MRRRAKQASIRKAVGCTVAVRMGDDVRLVWRRRPAVSAVAMASSRLPCSLNHWDAARRLAPWLDEARAWLRRIRSWESPLLVMEGATGAVLLRDVARRLTLPVIRGKVVGGWKTWRRALRSVRGDGSHQVLVSPPLVDVGEAERTKGRTAAAAGLPARDLALWRLAEHLVLLHARPGGGWSQLLLQRCDGEQSRPRPRRLSLCLALPNGCRRTAAAVAAAGGRIHEHRRTDVAAGRDSDRRPERPERPTCVQRRHGAPATTLQRVADLPPLWERQPALVHWTRACDGAWPDESPADRHVRLLLGGPEDHSARGALSRIAGQGRVHASASRIRSGDAVVCFTALSPMEVKPTYRRHLRRWDASGYGVAVSRSWLARLGARPVVYGDDPVWESLPPELKPFFQAEGRNEQWRGEQEWRLLGELRLRQLPVDCVELIVPAADPAAGGSFNDAPWTVRAMDFDF